MTEDSKDNVIFGIGAAIAALLVKLAGGWIQRTRKDPVELNAQNIAWAKDMMSRLETEIRELRERITELEALIEQERESRFECERKYRDLLARMHVLTQKVENK